MHGVVLFFVFTHFQMSKTCPIIHSGDSFLMYRNGLTSFHPFQILNIAEVLVHKILELGILDLVLLYPIINLKDKQLQRD